MARLPEAYLTYYEDEGRAVQVQLDNLYEDVGNPLERWHEGIQVQAKHKGTI